MNLEIGQIVSQIIAFLIMLWVLKRFAWKPLLGVMEERKQTIIDEFKVIDDEKAQLNNLKQSYNKKLNEIDSIAKTKMQDAIEKGRKIAEEIEADTQRQAHHILEKAKANADREIAQAKIELKRDVVNLALAATEKILREDIDQEKYQKLIASFVDRVEFK